MKRVTRDLDYIKERTTLDSSTGCWLWKGWLNGFGYGRVQFSSGSAKAAHRVAWEAAHGTIPEGLFVCHRCDVRKCCNPEHLFLGTNQDNVDDREAKGRNNPPRGSGVGTSKLSEADVAEIRRALDIGVRGVQLAAAFEVTKAAISMIKNGRRWQHLKSLEAAR